MTRLPLLLLLSVLIPALLHAHPSWGIAVDHNHQVYFSDLETIWKIDSAGVMTVFRAGVRGRHIHELTVDDAGNVHGDELLYDPATEIFTAGLWRMAPAGDFAYTLAPTPTPPKGSSIWRDHAGNSYSAIWKSNEEPETMILKRSPEGRVTTLFGNRQSVDSFRQVVLYSVGGVAFGNDGSLYLADGPDVWKVTTGGAVLPVARNIAPADPSSELSGSASPTRLLGLAVDTLGNLFVADHANRCVLKIAPDLPVSILQCAEDRWTPTGLAFRDGSLYILEFEDAPAGRDPRVRVRRMSPDGRFTRLGMTGESDSSAVHKRIRSQSDEPAIASAPDIPYPLIAAAAGSVALVLIAILRLRARQKNRVQEPAE